MLAPNSLLKDRYRIIEKIGGGGFGTVYSAIDETFGCCVAIKETREEIATLDKFRKAFEREAKLLRNLKHDSLPRVTDYFFEAQCQFLVMDFVEGQDLAALLGKRSKTLGPFTCEEVLPWADKVLAALGYLHSRPEPIIHRDIKPANIKLGDDGQIYLLDFGLAKGAAGQMSTVREDEPAFSLAAFTHAYAPLEQLQETGTQAQSDIYALGATLYHLLTGQVPISASQRDESIQRGYRDPLAPINELNPGIPPRISEIIANAMAVRWWDRTGSAREMRAALRAVGTIVGVEPVGITGARAAIDGLQKASKDNATTLLLSSLPQPGSSKSTATIPTQTNFTPQRFDRRFLVAAFVGLLVIITGALGLRWAFPQWFQRSAINSSIPANAGNGKPPVLTVPSDLRPHPKARHHGVWAVAFSRDGKLAASASKENTIIIWDTKTWQPKFSSPLIGHVLAFSPDGTILASGGSDNKIRLWDMQTGTMLSKAPPFQYQKPIYRLTFSSDGNFLASFGAEPPPKGKGGDTDIQIWDLRSNFPRTLSGEEGLTTIAFSPVNNLLFSAAHDKQLRVWDISKNVSEVIGKYSAPIRIITLSYDGTRLACTGDDKLIHLFVYDTEAGKWKEQAAKDWFNDKITSLAFSRDGKALVVTSADSSIKVFDVASPTSTAILLSQNQLSVQRASFFSPDGQTLLTAGDDDILWLWQ